MEFKLTHLAYCVKYINQYPQEFLKPVSEFLQPEDLI